MKPFIRRFYKTYLPGKGFLYFWGIFSLVLTIVTTTTIPNLLKQAINILESAPTGLNSLLSDSLFQTALTIIFLGILLAIFRVLSRVIIFIPGRQIESEIRQDYFDSLVRLSPKDLAGEEVGDLISRGTNDVTSVRVMLSMGILHSINCVLMVTICLYQMFQISGRLVVFCLIPAPFVLLLVKKLSRAMMDKAHEMQMRLGKLSEVVREHFGAHSLMATIDLFDVLYQRFQKANQSYAKANQDHVRIRTVLFLLSANFSHIASFILLFFGARDVLEGRLDLGSFAAFSSFLGLLQDPLRSAGFLISIFQRGEVCLGRIFEFIDRAQGIQEKEKSKPINTESLLQQNLKPQKPLIHVQSLQFPENSEGFQLVIDSLELQEGKKYGIFGSTGSGKTLLLNLLTGNLEVKPNTIFFRGLDYNDIPQELIRKQFSIIPQENKHFAKTIRENIEQVLNNPDLDLARSFKLKSYPFEEAYTISQLKEDVEQFPSGLDTLLGEHGINLSGGQRQRLSLVRALVKPHQILFLDDIVSSVDHQTEKNILRELYGKLNKDDTIFFISHRVSALIPCDEIIILEEGKIVMQGSHLELLNRHEDYRKTYRHQMLEEQIEA